MSGDSLTRKWKIFYVSQFSEKNTNFQTKGWLSLLPAVCPWTICLTSLCFHTFTGITLAWGYMRMQVKGPGMYVGLHPPFLILSSQNGGPRVPKAVVLKHWCAKNHPGHFFKQTFPCSGAVGQRWDWNACSPTTGQFLKPTLRNTAQGLSSIAPLGAKTTLELYLSKLNTWPNIFSFPYTVDATYQQVPEPQIQSTMDRKYSGEENFQKVPKSKTWIWCTQTATYITFTLYLQLFT